LSVSVLARTLTLVCLLLIYFDYSYTLGSKAFRSEMIACHAFPRPAFSALRLDVTMGGVITDHFSGPGRAIGPMSVCLHVRTITLK